MHPVILRQCWSGAQDHYDTLSYKTMALWKVVEEQYDAQYVLKVDDDNYVRLDRLAVALSQWADSGAGTIFRSDILRFNATQCMTPLTMIPLQLRQRKKSQGYQFECHTRGGCVSQNQSNKSRCALFTWALGSLLLG